jgi:RNA polymerase sigma-70 factor (ECF subfamily)
MPSDSEWPAFPHTRWTIVLHAGKSESTAARAALAALCEAYWYPLYAFVRRRGYALHDAQDLTQAFFAHVLEKQALGQVTPERGRFRTFLLAALKNFLANEWDKASAVKRGGGQQIISLDAEDAEQRYQREPGHEQTPERLYERRWALTLLEQVLTKLQSEYQEAGNTTLFDELYAAIASRLDRTEGAVKTAAHRLRRRYRDLVACEIAHTVSPSEVEDELRHLMEAVSRG